MTLPSSGPITIEQILVEIGEGYPVTIPNANWRTLSGVPSGPLVIPDHFWGKTWGAAPPPPPPEIFQFLGIGSAGGQSVFCGFGADHASRILIAVIHYVGSASSQPSVTSVTIGGVGAGVIISNSNRNTANDAVVGVAIAAATVPTGSSGTISYTLNTGTAATSAIGVYRETGGWSAFSSAGDDANSATKPATCNVTMPNLGIGIAASTLSTSGQGITWLAGPSNLAYQTPVGSMWVSGVFQEGMGAGLAGIQSTWASGDHGMALVAYGYLPA